MISAISHDLFLVGGTKFFRKGSSPGCIHVHSYQRHQHLLLLKHFSCAIHLGESPGFIRARSSPCRCFDRPVWHPCSTFLGSIRPPVKGSMVCLGVQPGTSSGIVGYGCCNASLQCMHRPGTQSHLGHSVIKAWCTLPKIVP